MIIFYYLLCFLPLTAAAALLVLKTEYKSALRFSIVFSFVELAVSFAVLFLPDTGAFGILTGSLSGFSRLMLFFSAFSFALGLINIKRYPDFSPDRYFLSFYFMMLGGVIGFFTAKDLKTGFIFFEIMSLSSWPLMSFGAGVNKKKTSYTYLAVTIICGMVGLYGLIMLGKTGGSLITGELKISGTSAFAAASVLFSIGYAAKAGIFPLHFWVPSAYTLAPFSVSSLLSAIVKKTGVFGLLFTSLFLLRGNLRFGAVFLILSVITMFLGAVMALLSPDLKYTLACSSISQLGFISLGLSLLIFIPPEENAAALAGTLLHSLNHTLSKLILFSLSGIVFYKLGSYDMNGLRGTLRRYPLLALGFILPMLSLAGIPMFSGYLSKTMLHESLFELAEHFGSGAIHSVFYISERLFLLTGGLTLAYMLKLFYMLFIVKPEREPDVILDSRELLPYAVMGVALLISGVFSNGLTRRLLSFSIRGLSVAELPDIHFFSIHNLQGALISVCTGLLVFFLVVRALMIRSGSFRTPFYDGYESLAEICLLPFKGLYSLAYAVARLPDFIINGKAIYSLAQFIALVPDKASEQLFGFLYKLGLFFSRAADTLVNVGFKGIILLLLKNQNRNIHSEQDEFFSSYDRAPIRSHAFAGSLLYGLLLCLLGLAATIAYLIIRNR